MTQESFSMQDRLALLTVLPAQGDITTIRIVQQLRQDLSFTEQEHERYGIVSDDKGIHWNPSVNGTPKTIEIGRKAREVIVQALEVRNRQGTLEALHLGVWSRFVDDEPATDLKLTETAS